MGLGVGEEVRVLPRAREAAREAADAVQEAARRALLARGVFRVALSGGRTPIPLHLLLADRPLDWDGVEIYFGDERAVPPDHEASNYRMARETLLDRLPVPPRAVHRIPGERGAAPAARDYEEEIRGVVLDLALLGLGADGHTASLFPGAPGLRTEERLVVPTRAPAPPRERVSLSLRALNAAREAIFLVTGPGKAGIVERVLDERRGLLPATRPASLVRPRRGPLWILDSAAAGGCRILHGSG